MKIVTLKCIIFAFFAYVNTSFAQAPNLGIASEFVLFTINGDVPNTSVSSVTGNIGTNLGTISGFDMNNVNSSLHIQDNTTAQASLDLQSAYTQLANTAVNMPLHAPAFGTETITAGVYGILGAGSIGGNLTLNAEGNSNAVFILKFGGAFTVGAGSNVILENGALAGNVFWVAEGAISMAANIIMKGTLIANNGANSLGANSDLEGRMYSTTGAITTHTVTVKKPESGGYTLPVGLLSFAGTCVNQNNVLNWETATEVNNDYFTIEKSLDGQTWKVITKINGSINSTVLLNYSYTDNILQKDNYYYRLKQTDLDGKFKYTPTILIKNCGIIKPETITIYPNPTTGKINLKYAEDLTKIKFMEVFNNLGENVFKTNSPQAVMDLTNQPSGIYYVRIHINTLIFTKEIIKLKHLP